MIELLEELIVNNINVIAFINKPSKKVANLVKDTNVKIYSELLNLNEVLKVTSVFISNCGNSYGDSSYGYGSSYGNDSYGDSGYADSGYGNEIDKKLALLSCTLYSSILDINIELEIKEYVGNSLT